MFPVIIVTLKGIIRDRLFYGLLVMTVLFAGLPAISSLSMRQATALSVTLALSLISFMLLLFALFLGGTSLWKDIDRRYILAVAGMPLSRSRYLLGKFLAVVIFLGLASLILGTLALLAIFWASAFYPPTPPLVWHNILAAIFYDWLKYSLLAGFAFLFASVGTSFFLPVFGTVAVFLAGSASQEVYDFVHSPAADKVPAAIREGATILYYVLPNFSAFDLKFHAIYSLPLSSVGLLLTAGYGVVYLALVLALAAFLFERRELL